MNLHETILNSVRGSYNLEENIDYPEGVTPKELSEISKSFSSQAKFLFIPADMVPESATSKKIVGSGQDLSSKYVVYRGFRRGVGHDSSYG